MAQKSLAEWYEETYRKKTPVAAPPVTSEEFIAEEPANEEVVAQGFGVEDAVAFESAIEEADAQEVSGWEAADLGVEAQETIIEENANLEPYTEEAAFLSPAASGVVTEEPNMLAQ